MGPQKWKYEAYTLYFSNVVKGDFLMCQSIKVHKGWNVLKKQVASAYVDTHILC